jgi:integrase
MSGKQAKILAANHIDDLLLFAETTRYPNRDRVIVLLSVKAGLRAAEIANLTWDMVLDPEGGVCTSLELRDSARCGSRRRWRPAPERWRSIFPPARASGRGDCTRLNADPPH